MHHSFWAILSLLIVSLIWVISAFIQVFSAKGSQRDEHQDYVIFTLGTGCLLFFFSLFFFIIHFYDLKVSIIHILKNNQNPIIPVVCLLIMLVSIGWLLFAAILFFQKSGEFPKVSANGFGGITTSYLVLCSLPYIAFLYYTAYKMHLIVQSYCPIRNASIFLSFGLTLGLPIFVLWLFMVIDKDAWNQDNKYLTITMTISTWIFIVLILLAILLGCCKIIPSDQEQQQKQEKNLQEVQLNRSSFIFISVFNIFINSVAPLLSILSLFSFIIRLLQPGGNVFSVSRNYASEVIVIIALSFVTGLIIPQMYNIYIYSRMSSILNSLTLIRWLTLMPVLEHLVSLGYIVVYCFIVKPDNLKEFIIETRALFSIVISSPFVLIFILLGKFLFFVSYNGCSRNATTMSMSILTIVLLVMYMIGFILSLIFLLMSQRGFSILNDNETKNLAIGFMTFIYLMAYYLLFNMPRIVFTLWPSMKRFFKERKKRNFNLNFQEAQDSDDDDDDDDDDELEQKLLPRKKKKALKRRKQIDNVQDSISFQATSLVQQTNLIKKPNFHANDQAKSQNHNENESFKVDQFLNDDKRILTTALDGSDSYVQKMFKEQLSRKNTQSLQKEKLLGQQNKAFGQNDELVKPLLNNQ